MESTKLPLLLALISSLIEGIQNHLRNLWKGEGNLSHIWALKDVKWHKIQPQK